MPLVKPHTTPKAAGKLKGARENPKVPGGTSLGSGAGFGIQCCEFANATALNRRRQGCFQRIGNDGRRRNDAHLDRGCPLQDAFLAAGLSVKYEVKTAVTDAADCVAGMARKPV